MLLGPKAVHYNTMAEFKRSTSTIRPLVPAPIPKVQAAQVAHPMIVKIHPIVVEATAAHPPVAALAHLKMRVIKGTIKPTRVLNQMTR